MEFQGCQWISKGVVPEIVASQRQNQNTQIQVCKGVLISQIKGQTYHWSRICAGTDKESVGPGW